jgi:sugar lactone lactonase YvrE
MPARAGAPWGQSLRRGARGGGGFADDTPFTYLVSPSRNHRVPGPHRAAGDRWRARTDGSRLPGRAPGRVPFASDLAPWDRVGRAEFVADATQARAGHRSARITIGPDGRLFACDHGGGRIVAFASDGTESVVAAGRHPGDLVVDRHGGVYFTDTADHGVWYVAAGGSKRVVEEAIDAPTGLGLLPGGSLLAVADAAGRWVWSFQARPDSLLTDGQAFYRLETTDQHSATGAAGVAVDSAGFIYVATGLGIQVCDEEGRTAFIIANPTPGCVTQLAFGGPDGRTFLATAGGKLFARPVRRKGA